MDSYSSGMDLPAMSDKQGVEELQEFLYIEQQKAQLRSQVSYTYVWTSQPKMGPHLKSNHIAH